MNRFSVNVLASVLAALAIVLSGCGNGGAKPPATSAPAAPAAGEAKLPEGLILVSAPAGAKDVGVGKAEAKEGDEVVLRGQVGGKAKDVFTPGYAAFLLADMKLQPCNAKPGDGCTTPWDFCCDPREEILANVVNVEIQGTSNKPLKLNLQGVQGIDHLSTLVVKGKVLRKDGPNLTLRAEGIFVEKAAATK